ncbi:hypothetical protein EUGRSUZ_B03213 [Eucalyptus grandis]|uniref:Uncharacterized protein n=2 Tax=Eucalyptus grandis TaxID=71139 RepID=A0ACC3LVS9_EUCGR|nr:hypothetical protein EUGRSUZ_B03213 [Eucalyptus grandis]
MAAACCQNGSCHVKSQNTSDLNFRSGKRNCGWNVTLIAVASREMLPSVEVSSYRKSRRWRGAYWLHPRASPTEARSISSEKRRVGCPAPQYLMTTSVRPVEYVV